MPLPGDDWSDAARARFLVDCEAHLGNFLDVGGLDNEATCGCVYDEASSDPAWTFDSFNATWSADDVDPGERRLPPLHVAPVRLQRTQLTCRPGRPGHHHSSSRRASIARTFSRVHAAHSRSTPRSDDASDHPSGSPSAGASAVVPHRAHVEGVGTTPRAWQAEPDMKRDIIQSLLDEAGATRNRDVLADIYRATYELSADGADRLDLKITRDALKEMRSAYRLFLPYAGVRKVTVFGSARTLTDRSALRPRTAGSPASWPTPAGWS